MGTECFQVDFPLLCHCPSWYRPRSNQYKLVSHNTLIFCLWNCVTKRKQTNWAFLFARWISIEQCFIVNDYLFFGCTVALLFPVPLLLFVGSLLSMWLWCLGPPLDCMFFVNLVFGRLSKSTFLVEMQKPDPKCFSMWKVSLDVTRNLESFIE